MTEKIDIIARIARNYFNIQDIMTAVKPVTVSPRSLRVALEATFEAGQGTQPDSMAIARAIAMKGMRNKHNRS